ncbi:MAG TPA: RNA polymerase sigma factor [Gaiellaceae bacterium]
MRTDAQLIAGAKTDASAFRELYDRYAERIHRLHLARSRDRDAALDLTAETFAQAWLSLDRFRDLADGSASPWLYAIARNVLVTSVRKRTLERRASDRLGVLVARERESHAPAPEVGWIEGLDEELASLSPELREAVRLRVLDDLPYADVAAATGTTVGAARVRVHRGLSALRQRLLQEGQATR